VKELTKARAPRRRHVLFEVKEDITQEELKNAIYQNALRFFGEYGCSFAQFKLSEYDEKTRVGILTFSRDYADKVPGFLALIEKPRIVAKRMSGTINKLKEKSEKD